uniref:NAC domain-containing protein n=1 Tax=Oryza glaberrima TaxID=4538 RepID=I1R0G6_ORYGL
MAGPQMSLPYDFITDIDILHHNPLDIVPTRQEKKNGKHFFTRKEKKHHGDNCRNHAADVGFWRKSSFAESMEWAMQEFQLAGSYLLPCFVMRFATSDGTEQPFGCTRVTIANMRHCILTPYCCFIG